MGNVLYFNNGGPTPVISNTMVGVLKGVKEFLPNAKFFTAQGGVGGFIKGQIKELDLNNIDLELVAGYPTTFIGTSREKFKVEYLEKSKEIIMQYNINYIFLCGGDDTQINVYELNNYIRTIPELDDVKIIGIPKTIDGDLPEKIHTQKKSLPDVDWSDEDHINCCDFTPGFPSAATYAINLALAIGAETEAFNRSQKGRHIIIEIPGRDCGKLCAATALIKDKGFGPHGIFVPENASSKREGTYFDIDKFADLILARQINYGWGVYIVSEGVKNRDGDLIKTTHTEADSFRGETLGEVVFILRDYVKKRARKFFDKDPKFFEKLKGIDVRCVRPGSELFRTCFKDVSKVDADVAELVGYDAVKYAAIDNKSGIMVGIKRNKDMSFSTIIVPTYLVQGRKSHLDARYLLEVKTDMKFNNKPITTFDISDEFLDWIRPLVGDLYRVN